ncbi:MAG: Fic family protein [Myxococcota bacterium]
MKIPVSPPPLGDCVAEFAQAGSLTGLSSTDAKGRYLHWDELRHRTPPEPLSHRAWWAVFKLARQGASKSLPLNDTSGRPFTYALPDPVLRGVHELDSRTHGAVSMDGKLRSGAMRDRYITTSLMEEAITSSQLEGAATTRKVAKQMLRTKRQPRNTHERMIVNNYRGMEWVREHVHEPLTPALVLELHRHLTLGTLERDDEAGRLRRPDEPIFVKSDSGEILHEPPSSESLPGRLQAMCDFANDPGHEGAFVPPIVRAILVHFWLAYDHPFVDGNGRTARALFYWSALRSGYWLLEFITISRVIKQAPAKYGRAFLHTETDDHDTTYFIIHQLDVLMGAIENLERYIQRSLDQQKTFDLLLRATDVYNHRQAALLRYALRHPDGDFTIAVHQSYHSVAYQTARTDLLDLESKGLLRSLKRGKALHFVPVDDLETLLAARVNG